MVMSSTNTLISKLPCEVMQLEVVAKERFVKEESLSKKIVRGICKKESRKMTYTD